MILLPRTIETPYLAPLDGHRLPLDRSCKRCPLGDTARNTVCLPDEGEEGGVLIVGEGPSLEDDAAGRPFMSRSGKKLRSALETHWSKAIAYANATRCSPESSRKRIKLIDKHVDACRPYLAQTIDEVKPTRIIALGRAAIEALIGKPLSPLLVRQGWAWLKRTDGVAIPVFFLFPPVLALRNIYWGRVWDEDIKWACTYEPTFESREGFYTPYNSTNEKYGQVEVRDGSHEVVVCVETEEESKAAIEELRKAKWSVFDVESGGVQFTKSFRLPCIAVTAEGSDVTYIWGDRKLADAKIRAPLLDYLCDPTTEKIGHNVKYDMVSIYSLWGRMPENVRIDTRILAKILDPECSAKLADLGYKVGYGGHKEENARGMQEAKDLVASILRDEKAQERASEKLALGELPKLPKKLNVPRTFESIGVDASLEAVIRNKNFEAEKWCFALVDRFVLYRYCAFDTVATRALYHYLEKEKSERPWMAKVWETMGQYATETVAWIEAWGIRCDRNRVIQADTYLKKEQERILLELDQITPGVNWSSPAQVSEFLFQKLRLHPTEFTATGAPSTSDEALEQMEDQHPVLPLLRDLRKVVKLKGTYTTGNDDNGGMYAHIRDDERIHPSYLVDGTRTGRMSSSDPNFYNQPRSGTERGRMIKDMYVASPGGVIIQGDFSQLELRCAASLSNDRKMVEMFQADVDFHLQTAQRIAHLMWKIKAEEVTKHHRDLVKPVVFGRLYGKSIPTLAKDLKCDIQTAEMMDKYIMSQFTTLAAWCQDMFKEALATGFAYTYWNGEKFRRRPLFDLGFTGDRLAFSKAMHGSWNGPVQGTAADLCQKALGEIVQWIRKEKLRTKVIVSVYDSIVFDSPIEEKDYVRTNAKRIMQSQPLRNGVPLRADFEEGESWGSLKKIAA